MLSVLRLLGWLLLLPAGCVIGWELAILAETGTFRLYTLGELWFELHPASLSAYRGMVEQHVSSMLWDKILAPMLLRQAVVVFALPGLALTTIPWLVDQLRHAGEPSMA